VSAGLSIAILGGGPAGVGAALWLARRGFTPTVVEARDRVGGNAGSFELAGLDVDYGSHRLHPATDPEILGELRALPGVDLLERPRHGRILLEGRWIHFPLRPLDLALHAPPAFVAGVALDAVRKLLPSRPHPPATRAHGATPMEAEEGETFASVLLRGLGPTICRDFYFPYARKIWGLEPEEISPTQARKRVGAGSLSALVRRLLPGGRGTGGRSGRGTFYYPRGGYGRISTALAEAAGRAGAEILLETRVDGLSLGRGEASTVRVVGPSGPRTLAADHVWSTIPIGVLARIVDPPAPPDVLEAAARLAQRAMLLVYLVVAENRFTEYDAHYFPSLDVPMTRLSEPKNYSGRADPEGRTVLCAEIPCATDDPAWSADAATLGRLVRNGLDRAGIPLRGHVLDVVVRRLPSAYPIYRIGWDRHFEALDAWMSGLRGVLSFGRQGLYAHDNTHHALAMAKAAVHCLADDGSFDEARWAAYREAFERHVVED
jgi:protoporphyrinogen oxidase